MANTTFNTRIQLKYDLYSNWTTNNPVLLAGEVAIATIPAAEGATSLNFNSVALPQVLIKVGDGTSHYNTLPFASALAADVYPWAKESQADFETRVKTLVAGLHYTKAEVYNKSEIDAFLAQYYKKTEIDAITGALADLNTTNKNNLVAAINEALQAVEVGGTGSVVSVVKEETPTEGSQATYKVTQGGNTVGVKIEIPVGYDETALAGRVSTIEGDYLKAADKTELEGKIGAKADTTVVNGIDGRVAAIEGDYLKAADIANFETKENVKKVADDLAGYIESNNGALAGVREIAEAAQTADEVATAINNKITELDLGNTYEDKGEAAKVSGALEAYKTSNDAAVALKADKTALEAEVARATGAEGALDTRVTKVETFFATAEGESLDTALDTLVEIQKYITTEGSEADQMVKDIAANKKAIEDEVARATGVEGGFETRIAALEGIDHNKILTDAKAYTDELANGAVKTNTEAIAAINNEESGILAQAKADATTKANKALEDAKADAAATYEKIGVAQGLVDGLGIGDYLKKTDAETTYEKAGVAQGLVNGLNIAQYETITGAEGKYATIANHNALAERVTATEGVANSAAAKAAENATAIGNLDTAYKAADEAINTEVAKKANSADLATVATSGKIDDLTQTNYIILNCGSSTEVI